SQTPLHAVLHDQAARHWIRAGDCSVGNQRPRSKHRSLQYSRKGNKVSHGIPECQRGAGRPRPGVGWKYEDVNLVSDLSFTIKNTGGGARLHVVCSDATMMTLAGSQYRPGVPGWVNVSTAA